LFEGYLTGEDEAKYGCRANDGPECSCMNICNQPTRGHKLKKEQRAEKATDHNIVILNHKEGIKYRCDLEIVLRGYVLGVDLQQ
jgi:hypothetical protein